MKKALISLIAALGLAFSSSTESRPFFEKPDIRYVDNLVLNTSNENRTAIKKSEYEGMYEMRKILEESELEEVWAFLPEKEEWREIGIKESPERRAVTNSRILYITRTELDLNYLEKLIRENNEIIIWHYSPKGSLLLRDEIKQAVERGNPLTEQEISKIIKNISVKEAIPSIIDLCGMISNSKKFYRLKPEGEISYKQCSELGTTEFKLTEKGKEYFQDKDLEQILVSGGIGLVVINNHFNNIIADNETEKVKKICRILSKGSDDTLDIKFKQYNSLPDQLIVYGIIALNFSTSR